MLMLSTLPISLLKTWYLYTANAAYIIPTILISYLVFEPDQEGPSLVWSLAEITFHLVAIISFIIYFYHLFPRHNRKKQAIFIISGLLLWQSLIAFFAWQYQTCDLRSKVKNWAFHSGRFECPRSLRHYISLKYLLEFIAEILWTPVELLFGYCVRLYKEHFGGGWLDIGAWIRWIFFAGSLYLFSGANGINGRGMVSSLLSRVPFLSNKNFAWVEAFLNLFVWFIENNSLINRGFNNVIHTYTLYITTEWYTVFGKTSFGLSKLESVSCFEEIRRHQLLHPIQISHSIGRLANQATILWCTMTVRCRAEKHCQFAFCSPSPKRPSMSPQNGTMLRILCILYGFFCASFSRGYSHSNTYVVRFSFTSIPFPTQIIWCNSLSARSFWSVNSSLYSIFVFYPGLFCCWFIFNKI